MKNNIRSRLASFDDARNIPMSMTDWLKKIFVPAEEDEFAERPVIWTEHLRIVLALLFVFLSACFMWWILA
ncbi:MAG: hypothetical protein K2H64_01405 [Desulfovibrio sp.]|nr:hypothetical protein [Desulfovibrio sp.]